MAAGHAVRGAATAALALIILEAVATSGTGRVAGFATDLSTLLAKAIDPRTPLIRDRRAAAAPAAGDGYGPIFTMTPEQTAGVARAVGNAGAGIAAASGQNPLINTLSQADYSGLRYLNPTP